MSKLVPVLSIVMLTVFGLSGCYMPIPNEQEVQITDYDARIFMVMGDKITNPVWVEDGQPVENQSKTWFYYYPAKIGTHTVEIHFKDNGAYRTHKWNIEIK